MPTKLGFQIGDKTDLDNSMLLEHLVALRPAAALVMNQVTNLDIVYAQLGAGPLYVFQRPNMPTVEDYLNSASTLDAAVETFLEDNAPFYQAARWAYHCSAWVTTLTPQAAEFEARAMQTAEERYRVRLCIGNFATPTPAPDAWPLFRPALEAAARYHALVGLEEFYPLVPYAGYGPNANIPDGDALPHYLRNEIPYPEEYRGAGQFIGRYRHLRDYCEEEDLPLQVFIRATGAERVLPDWLDRFGDNLGPWRTLPVIWRQFGFVRPDTHYAEDMIWLDQHVYRQDKVVVGACVSGWQVRAYPKRDIAGMRGITNRLEPYFAAAHQDPSPSYTAYPFNEPQRYVVTVSRLRIRPLPSVNNKYIGGLLEGDIFDATEYTFAEGYAWLRHSVGWSAYAALDDAGQPIPTSLYVQGPALSAPRESGEIARFVGTIEDVRQFMRAHEGRLFYISINPDTPPEGARQFRISVFPAQGGRAILDALHPDAGDPLMTPGARRALRD